jgi:Ca2+-dependent lipid-binding protein
LQLGSQRQRTKTKSEAGKKPVWNETFRFNVQNNDLKVTVMDEDTMKDDLVGEGDINVSKFRANSSEQDCMKIVM